MRRSRFPHDSPCTHARLSTRRQATKLAARVLRERGEAVVPFECHKHPIIYWHVRPIDGHMTRRERQLAAEGVNS
jgi:hypothetical protein